MNEPQTERLNKFLALHLGVSRREADLLIEETRVTVNARVATLGARVSSDDSVAVDDKPISIKADYRYVVFHKPAGYVCSRRQQGEIQTIYSILPEELHTLKPVGRLDKDTSGILLLTNDGDFAHHMTHPSFHKQKTYTVVLDRELAPLHQQMISDYGVQLEDGPSKLILTRNSDTDRLHWYIDMHEGRNRQIRRTFAALGYATTSLHRTKFGDYSLGDIQPGEFKLINIS